MQVSKHASMLTEDYDKEFSAAMNRAIEGLEFDGTLSVCEGQAIHAMMGTAPKCDGTSFSQSIAQTMDDDAELQSAIKEHQCGSLCLQPQVDQGKHGYRRNNRCRWIHSPPNLYRTDDGTENANAPAMARTTE